MLVPLRLEKQGVSEVRRARGENSHPLPRFAKKLKSPKKLIFAEEAHRLRGAKMILLGAEDGKGRV